LHRDDAITRTREGQRRLARDRREETVYDLGEPKKRLPREGDDERRGGNVDKLNK
jgi:hypothetical protein